MYRNMIDRCSPSQGRSNEISNINTGRYGTYTIEGCPPIGKGNQGNDRVTLPYHNGLVLHKRRRPLNVCGNNGLPQEAIERK